ncbi:hypothetical protein M436DRAFT_59955 [Aureobasidium namibiae CBS 147.97]|uniref:Uncharacterized protein n=1 Tax=Aureobasidium namibiae CBS 147.97 TaxID=1043004 RepID=A0A074X2L3_9PEZI|nr:uncharacterized protein M436DRAFT_59955 [Aureobasidium namibiae CBS 147.97]KEQ78014.1 hypothetical protein M436DRAFT_59955 [Aureobasidium namibiae CBS 147.97]
MSRMAFDPSEVDRPPPPYEQICNDWNPLVVGKDGWLYTKDTAQSTTGFWCKTIRNDPTKLSRSFNDIILLHCGISEYGEEGGEPDCTFTCGLLPRNSTIDKQSIANLCGGIAWGARTHRGLDLEYCECTFQDLRRGVRCDKGGRWFYRFLDRFMAWKVRRWMERHDKLCGCNCFDTPVSSGDLPLYTKS